MKPQQLLYPLVVTVFLLVPAFSKADPTGFDAHVIKSRVEGMKCLVEPRYTSEVERYIKRYLARNGRSLSIVLGRSATYFPVFEKYLREHELPTELKYLAVVESALNPNARSPVGAGGLWQFMRQTGRLYGLEVSRMVDERSCAHRATEAAMNYLAQLHERFGSWELALAAYNSGAGTVMRAQRRARAEGYWKIARYLPRETRNFVPAFIGVTYLFTHYADHGVEPELPHLDMQLTDERLVFIPFDLETVARVTGLPLQVVKDLNPHFRSHRIPESEKGYFVMLPSRVIPALEDYIDLLHPETNKGNELPPLPPLMDTGSYNQTEWYGLATYEVVQGDNLESLAALFNCSPHNLRLWNNLPSDQLKKGQKLKVWYPKEIRRFGQEVNVVKVKPPRRKPQPRTKAEVPPAMPPLPVPALGPLVLEEEGEPLPPPVVEQWSSATNEQRLEIATQFEQKQPKTKLGRWFKNLGKRIR